MIRIFLIALLLSDFIVFHTTNSFAQPPAPIQVSPQGAIATNSPDFVWQAVPGAVLYLLYVEDSNGVLHQSWHSIADTNCISGTGNCSFKPTLALTGNPTTWYVLSWDNSAVSLLSSGLTFFVGAPNILSAIKLNMAVEINGTNLHAGADPTVTLGGTPLTVLSKDANGEQVIAELPQNARSGAYELNLENPNGATSIDFNFKPMEIVGLALNDGNGNEIGKIIHSSPFGPGATVEVPVTLSNGTEVWILLGFSKEKLYKQPNGPYFTTADCTGTPYINKNADYRDWNDTKWFSSFLVPEETPAGLYVSTSINAVSSLSINSYWRRETGSVQCESIMFISIFSLVEAELIDGNIEGTFPPPYSLETP